MFIVIIPTTHDHHQHHDLAAMMGDGCERRQMEWGLPTVDERDGDRRPNRSMGDCVTTLNMITSRRGESCHSNGNHHNQQDHESGMMTVNDDHNGVNEDESYHPLIELSSPQSIHGTEYRPVW